MIRVASFDVFDTLLTRSIGGSRQVFVATGRRLHRAGLVSIEAEAYAAAREQAGWDLTPDNALHPPLDRIAGELAARLGLAQAQSTSLLEAELDTEREVCRAVPGAAARVEKARQDTGRGVAHISDTPLPEAFLRELLVREGLFRDGDRLYTSAGCGASKQEGALFDVVAADLGVVPAEIAHVGDDRWSDLAHARIHGWNAELDTRAHFTAHERRLDQDAVATDGLGPRLAAASRMGRLRALEAEGDDDGLAGIAGGVALPLLAGFGLWVLRQAQLLELDRLYFVARDGEVFREVTRQLAAQAGYGIDCRYLYGSRMAWQLASTGTSAYARHPELWFPDEESAESVSMRALLALVDLSPADAYAVTGLPMFTADRADDRLGADGWAQLQPLLAAGPMVEEIHQRARTRRDLMVRYLDQEEVTAPGRVVWSMSAGPVALLDRSRMSCWTPNARFRPCTCSSDCWVRLRLGWGPSSTNGPWVGCSTRPVVVAAGPRPRTPSCSSRASPWAEKATRSATRWRATGWCRNWSRRTTRPRCAGGSRSSAGRWPRRSRRSWTGRCPIRASTCGHWCGGRS